MESARTEPARLDQGVVEDLLWIGKLFELGKRGKAERHLAPRIIGGASDGRLIKKKPGLLHSDRDDADRGLLRRGLQMPPDLLDSCLERVFLCIAVNEEQMAWIEE
jgi:hypothetical protein